MKRDRGSFLPAGRQGFSSQDGIAARPLEAKDWVGWKRGAGKGGDQGQNKVNWNPFDKIPLNLPFTKGDFKYPPLKKGAREDFGLSALSNIDSTK